VIADDGANSVGSVRAATMAANNATAMGRRGARAMAAGSAAAGNSFASVPIARYPTAVRERPVRSDTIAATRKTTATRSKLSEPKTTSCGASAHAPATRDLAANGATR